MIKCLVLFVTLSFAADTIIVNTPLGLVKGNKGEFSNSFLGVPFSQPPIGPLRWALPQPLKSYGGTIDATEFGPGCPQNCELPPHTCPASVSEDCLQLNVYQPSGWTPGDALRPVLFYMPGGNFRQGSAGTGLYDSRSFSNRTDSVIVVSNYRLGALGWLIQENVPTNLGLHDQRMALRWVQTQIKSFGGDPTQVTIFGQSAGATSVCIHLVSDLSKGLFNAAISESNPLTLPLKDIRRGKTMSKHFSKHLGCKVGDIACLRSMPVANITAAQKATNKTILFLTLPPPKFFFPLHPLLLFNPWTPVVLTDDLPHQPVKLIREGKGKNIPTLFGTVANEATLFIYLAFGGSGTVSEGVYYGFLVDVFNLKAPQVWQKYPPSLKGSTAETMAQLGTDFMFTCATRYAIQGQQKVNKDTYLYKFEHVMSFAKSAWGDNFKFCWNVSCHGQEIAYVFDPDLKAYGFNFTPEERLMSQQMETWWSNLGRSGTPNSPVKPSLAWPAYDPASNQNMRIMTPSLVQTDLKGDICDFWDGIDAYDRLDRNKLIQAFSKVIQRQ